MDVCRFKSISTAFVIGSIFTGAELPPHPPTPIYLKEIQIQRNVYVDITFMI